MNTYKPIYHLWEVLIYSRKLDNTIGISLVYKPVQYYNTEWQALVSKSETFFYLKSSS